jgi:hypothetical protein
MPRYHFAVSTQLGTTTRTGRKCQTTLPLGTTPSESFGRYSTARNTTGRDGRWRSGRAIALCGKSPLKRWSQITMAEGANCAEDCASRRMLRRGDFNGALCLCSPSLQLCCLARRRGRHGTAGRRGCARVRCESDEWIGVATRRQLGALDDGGLANRADPRAFAQSITFSTSPTPTRC